MKTVFVAVAMTVLFVAACERKPDELHDVEAVRRIFDEFREAINGRNPDSATAMMSDRVFYAEANAPALIGREEVKSALQRVFKELSDSLIEYKLTALDVQIENGFASARGVWGMKVRHGKGLWAPIEQAGAWSAFCRTDGNGRWRWESMTLNSDRPIPGFTADRREERTLAEMVLTPQPGFARAEKALRDLKPPFRLQGASLGNVRVHVLGEVAVVSFTGEFKGSSQSGDSTGTLEGLDLFVRKDGAWQLACSQDRVRIPGGR